MWREDTAAAHAPTVDVVLVMDPFRHDPLGERTNSAGRTSLPHPPRPSSLS